MIDLQLTVELESPLHIGGEVRQDTDANRPILKTRDGFPYIPATSIKGILRHQTEQLLRRAGYSVCHSPRPENMCQQPEYSDLCPVCQLFGSPWHESTLSFQRLELSREALFGDHKAPKTTERTSVSLNRKRRIAEDQRVFSTELFAPGLPLRFSGDVRYRGGDAVELTPLYLAAQSVYALGGSRSRGLGWCRVTIEPDTDLKPMWETWKAEHGE